MSYELVVRLFDLIYDKSHLFLSENNIDEYAINYNDGWNSNTLKYLAYIHLGMTEEARIYAQNEVNNGKSGGFSNEGKTFFEWALLSE